MCCAYLYTHYSHSTISRFNDFLVSFSFYFVSFTMKNKCMWIRVEKIHEKIILFFFFFMFQYACSCGVLFIFALIMFAYEMVTVSFVIYRREKKRTKIERWKIKQNKNIRTKHFRFRTWVTKEKCNNLHWIKDTYSEYESLTEIWRQKDRLAVRLKWVFGHFVKCHKCNIGTICCLIPSFMPNILP